MDDGQIVALYWARDEQAIAETEQKYGPYLGKIACNVLSDWEDSQECVNDTYLRAWNSMPDHRPALLSAYLGKIVRQLAIDVYRKRHSQKRYASEFALSLSELGDSFSDGATPEEALHTKELDEALDRFLRGLPETARTAFIGRYFFFDSIRDIALYCGMREPGVKSLLYRTRQGLKTFLKKEGYDL